MSLFDSLNETTEQATDIGEKYFNASRDYFKLKIFKQLVVGLSYITKLLIFSIVFMLAVIFLAISSALAIGNALESEALGFLIVGGILLLIAVIVVFSAKQIDNAIIRKLVEKFFK